MARKTNQTGVDSSRGGRKGTDPSRQTGPRPNQGSRDGTSSLQTARRGGGSAGVARPNKGNDTTSNGAVTATSGPSNDASTLVTSEVHVPLDGFNAGQVENMLQKTTPSNSTLYKAESTPQSTSKLNGPWGAKPTAMANGKDFWLELRKQVAALQSTGGTSQGG